MRRRYEGKVAFITGAARGQGRAEAVRFAEEGAAIIAVDACAEFASTTYPSATTEDLTETVRLVEAAGGEIVASKVDTRDFEALSATLAAGIEQFGRLDVVVANAGICSAALSWQITGEQWHEMIDVNITGAFHTAKAAVPFLIEQGEGGAVVFTSSVAGLKGYPFMAHYVASKHAITGLAKSMANELGAHSIRVNTVHPAGVATDMRITELGPLLEEYATTLAPIFMNTLPIDAADVSDIASVIAWLCSDEAAKITGAQIPVDLGNLNR
ncbi:3-ketoacyl-ACP reductase [Nocardia neocaledoniensis NBRC 108232]|uniref:SDR family mycofactocin-dependent oxidoreductase n=1 Tax=Nocardia neocaledoniensis TaxID=236511 RepID=A0A317NIL5_9NOCA|nr:mycofactocin-coupled SDR family oxidoreductase [Nocardia neocaledoniensis]PWV74494.1 SDR family mycofactocin-dependent oxidoreductase [Nocardia neocaledoniensis]GEM29005.1 3-ketoacyl-ACP reductase [Nocardia neocaledoniensis NBRC 108232]